MDKRVTVLLPNGRRQNVPVTANTTLLEILETASAKHGFSSDEYCLKFHNKEVSLSQMFRFSGLPNNCVLEMEPTDRKRSLSNVTVCVQLADGSRKQNEFSPSENIWSVVEKLCQEEAQSFESPVVIYMRSEVIGKERMQQTTLKSLGIMEGRAMVRFIDKRPEDLKTQANVYNLTEAPPCKIYKECIDEDMPQTSRAAATTASSSSSGGGGGGGFAITANMVKSLKRTDEKNGELTEGGNESSETADSNQTETDKPKYDWGSGSGYTMQKPEIGAQTDFDDEMNGDESEMAPQVNIIGPRQAVLFSLDATEKQIEDLPDSFFDLTVNDLKMVLRDLKRTASGTENAPLLTAKLRELERQKTMLNKLNQYKECVLRIQFPDRHVLQGIFKPHEDIAKVQEFICGFLEHPQEEFELFTIPRTNILSSEQTLLELNFVPNAIVHFAYKEERAPGNTNSGYIKQEYLDQVTSENGAHYAVQKYRLSRANT